MHLHHVFTSIEIISWRLKPLAFGLLGQNLVQASIKIIKALHYLSFGGNIHAIVYSTRKWTVMRWRFPCHDVIKDGHAMSCHMTGRAQQSQNDKTEYLHRMIVDQIQIGQAGIFVKSQMCPMEKLKNKTLVTPRQPLNRPVWFGKQCTWWQENVSLLRTYADIKNVMNFMKTLRTHSKQHNY